MPAESGGDGFFNSGVIGLADSVGGSGVAGGCSRTLSRCSCTPALSGPEIRTPGCEGDAGCDGACQLSAIGP
jgi:hypothetical protein